MTTGRTGGRIIVDQMLIHGADTAFCVPGESYLPVMDALYDVSDRIRLIATRHEAAAVNMAEAYGKLTGRPGLALVTRGPGALQGSVGLHTAAQDSTPMILFIGQVASSRRGREGFQEVDYELTFRDIAKWSVEIRDPKRIPEIIARAYNTAVSGRPGPVVIALPEDVLSASVDVQDAGAYTVVQAHPGFDDIQKVYHVIRQAQRPMVVVGGSAWRPAAVRALRTFVEEHNLPVVTSFRRQDLIDNESNSYAGTLGPGVNPALAQRIREADVILAVGARLGELTTSNYTLLQSPVPVQTLVHVHPGAEELGRVFQAKVAINSGPTEFVSALGKISGLASDHFADWCNGAHADYMDFSTTREEAPPSGYVDLGRVVAHLSTKLPADSIITNGAGNYTIWAHRYYRFTQPGTQIAPTSGAMGYGFPAGLAAKIVHPDREVIVFAGDGCFLMTGTELATAVQYGLNVVVLVVNNGAYGTIRMHQERRFPGRVIGTELRNPDFTDFARAFGAYGERVTVTEEFPAALERARRAGRPALLELVTDPKVLTPTFRLE